MTTPFHCAIAIAGVAALFLCAPVAYAVSVDNWCVRFGLCDPPDPEPHTIDVVCDPTADCTIETLRVTLSESLSFCAKRPGSDVRLWMMGRRVADVVQIASAGNSARDRMSKKSREAEARRFVERELPRFLAAAQLALAEVPDASPIAETLTVVSWAETRTRLRQIIVITDGRLVSFADFECGPLPDEDTWVRLLAAHHSLAPRSLEGAVVHFAFVGVRPVKGRKCPVSLDRESEIRALWRVAVNRAGGTLFITTGAARLIADSASGGAE